MSLIAHYPLTNDVKDYSGNKYDLTNYGAIKDNNGKIGGTYRFTDQKYMSMNNSLKANTLTFSFWVKANRSVHGQTIFRMTEDAIVADYSNNQFRFFIYPTTGAAEVLTFTDTDDNKWNHYVCIYNSVELKVYKNGLFVKNLILTSTAKDSNYFLTLGCRDAGTNSLQGEINDFRVYNHVLSHKEIKDLAKAKILHYDFNQPTYNTINVLTNTNLDTGWSKGYCAGIRWDDITPPKGIESKVVSFIDADDQNGYWYCYGDYCLKSTGKQYTVSMYIKTNDSNFRIKFYTADNTESSDGVSRYNSEYINVPNDGQWHRIIWAPFTNHANSFSQSLSFHFYYGNPVGETQRTWFCAPQCEEGNKATPFIEGTAPTYIIRDKSGFQNDSIPITNDVSPQWIEDSKIGTGCYKFNGSNVIKTKQLFFDNANQEWTVCGWVKLDRNDKTQNINNFNLSNRITHATSQKALLYINDGVNDSYVYSSTIMPIDEWIHFAYVLRTYDNTCKFYLNGQLNASSSNYTSIDIPRGFNKETIFGEGLEGYLDDMRIYATVLDQEAINELYSVRASINKDGSLFANCFETFTKQNIKETGVVQATLFNEVGITKDLIAYYPLDNNLKDYSGHKKHLTGTYEASDGIKNQAIKTTNMTTLPTTKFSFGNSGTISAWGRHIDNTAKMLFSFNTDATYGPDLYFAHDVISWNTGDGGGNPFKKNDVPQGYTSANEWHHYVVVIDAKENKISLYIDGEHCGDAIYKSAAQTNKNFVIGANNTADAYMWIGDIDHVKVSDSCWTEKEIKIEYETTAKNKVLINKDGTIYANQLIEI